MNAVHPEEDQSKHRSRSRTVHFVQDSGVRLKGQVIAGFAAFKDHLSYFPFSGSVLGQLPDDIAAYAGTKSALHFPIEKPLPKGLVKKLIEVRLGEIRGR